MTRSIFSPRAISENHGTGVQLRYLMEQIPNPCIAFNYLFPEPGVDDLAISLESFFVRHWPFKLRGRRFFNRHQRIIPFRYWSDDELTSRGVHFLRSQLSESFASSPAVVVVHDEQCAKRFNSIHELTAIPYSIILYDWMHVHGDDREAFPHLAKCLDRANEVYAISPALRRLAERLTTDIASVPVNRIGFYRPRPEPQSPRMPVAESSAKLNIFVLADAKEGPFRELIQAFQQTLKSRPSLSACIHFVGNPNRLVDLPECQGLDRSQLIFHGVVSSADRDRIASECDVAFLAGPAADPSVCPLAKYSLPSKLGDFAALGLAVIARIAPGSAAHQAIEAELNGFVVPVFGVQDIERALNKIVDNRSILTSMRLAALQYAEAQVVLPGAIQTLPLFAPSLDYPNANPIKLARN